ncbi:MAG: glycosyltransferase family 39 protein [Candidatus Roizmanbacteria bacterium]|nr:glycosyltransferase family 39 protein [Candidatus Roizmanbacteria bacterium]
MKKKDFIILGLILLVAFVVRLYKIDAPLADFHSWRQADTAAVGRNFERTGFNFFMPTYDDLSNLQSGVDNPKGLRFVEFPLYNASFAGLHMAMPFLSLETWARLVAVLFSLLCIGSLYYLALAEAGRPTAIFTAITYAIMPFFVYFSRVILPETPAISLAIFSIFLLHLFTTEKTKGKKILWFSLSSISFAVSLLIKPTTAFYGLPLLVLFIRKYKYSIPKQLHVFLYFILAAAPLLMWRYYITNYPEGIPASNWLFTMVNTSEGQKEIFMRPAFFRWIFYERLNNIIMGGYLTVFFVLGIIRKQKTLLPLSIIAAGFIYIFVFQGGNVQHEYYQVIAFPAIALAIGLGVGLIIESTKTFLHPVLTTPIIIVIFSASFLFSWYQVKGYYVIPQDLLLMAKIIQTFTKPTDKVIADRMGDTTLLYLADRKGAPLLYREIGEMKKMGYKYILTDKREIIQKLTLEKYEKLFENNQFALFAL